jgi:hypothetical protein
VDELQAANKGLLLSLRLSRDREAQLEKQLKWQEHERVALAERAQEDVRAGINADMRR